MSLATLNIELARKLPVYILPVNSHGIRLKNEIRNVHLEGEYRTVHHIDTNIIIN